MTTTLADPYVSVKGLTILEGPDCGGKTTLAQELRSLTLAHDTPPVVFGLGSLSNVTDHALCRFYMDAMMPAFMGLAPVVMDRSWFSEHIYAAVYRKKPPRVSQVFERMLVRVAMKCDAQTVYCRSSGVEMRANFMKRLAAKGEMLDSEEQWNLVVAKYDALFGRGGGSLRYDFRSLSAHDDRLTISKSLREPRLQKACWRTAGNFRATSLLVGDSFANHSPQDHLVQFPFVSFNNNGCSAWLTAALDEAGIPEHDLFWGNQDCPNIGRWFCNWVAENGKLEKTLHIYALGNNAWRRLKPLVEEICKTQDRQYAPEITLRWVNHPSHHRRFHRGSDYPLLEMLSANR